MTDLITEARELASTLDDTRRDGLDQLEALLKVPKTLIRLIDALEKAEERGQGCEHCRGWDKRCGANYCPLCGRELEDRPCQTNK